MNNGERKYKPLELDAALRFGKHKGADLRWVIDNDIEYVEWMVGERIELSNEAYKYYEKAKRGNR